MANTDIKLRALAFALVLFDGVMTYLAVEMGFAEEGSPLMRAVMESIGMAETVVIRQAVAGWLLLQPKLQRWCVELIAVVYGVLAIIHVLLMYGATP